MTEGALASHEVVQNIVELQGFALTGLHTLYTSLDCILDLQLKIKNFKVDKYSLKNFHQMTQASPRWLRGSMDC
jgi:hypothetical protein